MLKNDIDRTNNHCNNVPTQSFLDKEFLIDASAYYQSDSKAMLREPGTNFSYEIAHPPNVYGMTTWFHCEDGWSIEGQQSNSHHRYDVRVHRCRYCILSRESRKQRNLIELNLQENAYITIMNCFRIWESSSPQSINCEKRQPQANICTFGCTRKTGSKYEHWTTFKNSFCL